MVDNLDDSELVWKKNNQIIAIGDQIVDEVKTLIVINIFNSPLSSLHLNFPLKNVLVAIHLSLKMSRSLMKQNILVVFLPKVKSKLTTM